MFETDRLVLRQFTEDDAADLLALDSDPEVMRWIGPVRQSSVDDYRQLIRKQFLPYYERNLGGFWVAVAKEAGAFLGWLHLRPALDYRFAREAQYRPGDFDLGYRLSRAAWGSGYATEGSRALIELALAEWGAQRIVSCALIGNLASIRVMEKVGLRRDGEFRIPGYDMALVRYAGQRKNEPEA
jgi:RimJ/RimL family protein N-acetyltransferase